MPYASTIKTGLLFLLLPVLLPVETTAQKFAIIGDYGNNSWASRRTANLVKSWDPEFIITLGDNNYYRGEARTIDRNIGKHYHRYLYPYNGRYGKGADTTRFFPSIGNHDIYNPADNSYFDYFTLPGNERYYDFHWQNVHFFVLNSNPTEPDGILPDSRQAQWLKQKLSQSRAPWKVVCFHHPPYSSGAHGSNPHKRWPFAEWGATVVLSGHDHHYERIEHKGMVYLINGLGGAKRYPLSEAGPVAGSQVRYNQQFGAMRAEATPQKLVFEFVNTRKQVIDRVEFIQP